MSRVPLRALQSRVATRGWRTGLLRVAVLAIGWWILSERAIGGTVFGVLVVALAWLASSALPSPSPSPRWRLRGVLAYASAFLRGSLRGGFDVARRVLGRRVEIAPRIVDYTLRLPEGAARNLLLASISSMPGTLVVGVEGDHVSIHALAAYPTLADGIGALEARVAAATGERMEDRHA